MHHAALKTLIDEVRIARIAPGARDRCTPDLEVEERVVRTRDGGSDQAEKGPGKANGLAFETVGRVGAHEVDNL